MLKKVFTIIAMNVLNCNLAYGYEIIIDSTYYLTDQNPKKLYNNKLVELSQGEQKYIQDNMEIMRHITQDTLNRISRVNIREDYRLNSTNVIEFNLHPNGDMTDFKFLQNSNYYILDDTTKETIEYAYSKYPRPAQKTLIRYKFYYNANSKHKCDFLRESEDKAKE